MMQWRSRPVSAGKDRSPAGTNREAENTKCCGKFSPAPQPESLSSLSSFLSLMSSPASSTSQGVVEHVQSFVAENKRVILIGAAITAVAIGGAAYYASTSGSLGGGDSADKSERKKDKKKGKKRKTVKDDDLPILEEIVPPPAQAQTPKVVEVPEGMCLFPSRRTHLRERYPRA